MHPFYLRHCILLLLSSIWLRSQAQTTKVLRVNPNYAGGGNVSHFFDSVTYIPLETSKESIFGDIQNLQVSKHYFVFYDYSTDGIFIFDKKGKFISKINGLPGHNKDNTLYLHEYVLNTYNEKVYLPYYVINKKKKGSPKMQIAIFLPNGQLERTLNLDTALFKDINVNSFAFLDSSTVIFAKSTQDSTNNHYFAVIKDFNTWVQNKVPFYVSDPFISFSKIYQNSTNAAGYSVWTRNHDYDIMVMRNQALTKYRFVFPQSISLDSSVYKDTSMMKDFRMTMSYDNHHKDKIANLYNIYLSGNLLTFVLMKGNSFSLRDCYLMNLSSGNLYNMDKITPDSLSAYLPINSASVSAADEDYIYNKISAHRLFQAKEDNEYRHPVYSAVLQRFFSTQSRKSNSVIVVLKPKKNL